MLCWSPKKLLVLSQVMHGSVSESNGQQTLILTDSSISGESAIRILLAPSYASNGGRSITATRQVGEGDHVMLTHPVGGRTAPRQVGMRIA